MEQDFLSHIRREEQPRGSLRRFFKRIGFFLSLLVAVFAIATWLGSVVFSKPTDEEGWYKSTAHVGFFGTLRNLILNDEGKLDGINADRINILFLGMGGEGHDGAFLTDTIMLASIKPSTKEIALTSIPRDLSAPIPGYGWRKINHANAFGELKEAGKGADFAIQVIEQVTAQPIHYYIRMDFSGFERLIDEIDGIDVVVDRTFTDPLFPTDNYKIKTITFEAGPQHMDGKTALTFARSRHGNNNEGSDFARSRRQQKVILAFKEKLLSLSTLLNPAKINHIIEALQAHMDTNVTIDTGLQLARMGNSLDTSHIQSLVLTDAPNGLLAPGTGENEYTLFPKDRTYRQIQHAIANIFSGNDSAIDTPRLEATQPTVTRNTTTTTAAGTTKGPAPFVEIQNGTWVVGLAAKIEATLKERGLTVEKVDNADNRPYSMTVIYDLSNGTQQTRVQELQKALHAQIIAAKTTALPTHVDPRTNILVILGKDQVTDP